MQMMACYFANCTYIPGLKHETEVISCKCLKIYLNSPGINMESNDACDNLISNTLLINNHRNNLRWVDFPEESSTRVQDDLT